MNCLENKTLSHKFIIWFWLPALVMKAGSFFYTPLSVGIQSTLSRLFSHKEYSSDTAILTKRQELRQTLLHNDKIFPQTPPYC